MPRAGIAVDGGEELGDRAAVVDRRDQRLDQGHRAVERTHVAPRLEIVGFGRVPVAELCGLVVIEPEVHTQWHLFKRCAEVDVRRRREDRIRPEDEKHLDATCRHVGDEFNDRCPAIRRRCGHWRVVGNRRADIAERLVHRARERVDCRRLMIAGHDHRGAAVRAKVLGNRWNPARGDVVRQRAGRGARDAQRRRKRARKRQDVARLQRRGGDRRSSP